LFKQVIETIEITSLLCVLSAMRLADSFNDSMYFVNIKRCVYPYNGTLLHQNYWSVDEVNILAHFPKKDTMEDEMTSHAVIQGQISTGFSSVAQTQFLGSNI
jgi:hypothetical protein